MKMEIMKVSRHIGGTVKEKVVQVEHFESVSEAISFLGGEEALKYLNYTHSLVTRSKVKETIR